ncbi:MAG: Rnf-Nqr domain containing protein, partial [Oscillospiraceae bacterium]|nr:Rnf-Nqr domain containing protein [Oscillospiraceae bacterium]
MSDFIRFSLAAAVLQNVVLITGFGSSAMIRISRKRLNIVPFSLLLCIYSTLTIVVCLPLDELIGTGMVSKWLRPLMIMTVTAVLYIISVIYLKNQKPKLYSRI